MNLNQMMSLAFFQILTLNLKHMLIVNMSSSRRVTTKQSPHFKAFYGYHTVLLTLDTGAEIGMIRKSVADCIGAMIERSTQNALQADGVTSLNIVVETHKFV